MRTPTTPVCVPQPWLPTHVYLGVSFLAISGAHSCIHKYKKELLLTIRLLFLDPTFTCFLLCAAVVFYNCRQSPGWWVVLAGTRASPMRSGSLCSVSQHESFA